MSLCGIREEVTLTTLVLSGIINGRNSSKQIQDVQEITLGSF